MRLFLCLISTDGRRVPESTRRSCETLPRARELAFEWHETGCLASLVCATPDGDDATRFSHASGQALGNVRLDNRESVKRLLPLSDGSCSDLELVARTVLARGPQCVLDLVGDFAFVIFDTNSQMLVAACDALGMGKLYYTETQGILAIASRAEALNFKGEYELQYLSERASGRCPTPGLTPYRGVRAILGGTVLLYRHERVTLNQYWSPYDISAGRPIATSEPDAVEQCRTLFLESVRSHLNGQSDVWAQLSGGIDSSSVVSAAQFLHGSGRARYGLAGTLTFVDPHGLGGDERRYATAVAERWGVRNDVVVEQPPAWSDAMAIPATDEPVGSIDCAAREYRLSAVVRSAGGSVLLTGAGGDILFTGTMFFFADWLAQGRVMVAFREMLRRASMGRASFWELAYRNALLPLLPAGIRRQLVQEHGTIPTWIARDVVRKYGLRDQHDAPALYGGRVGKKYADAAAAMVLLVQTGLPVGVLEENLDVRHPFYYRPLVEFALTLPPEMCARPYARKWVLREAMRGLLPEVVRQRIGKGTYNASTAWSMASRQSELALLLEDPVLGELGIVDVKELRAALGRASRDQDGHQSISASVACTLAIEAWLQVRSGRWPRGQRKTNIGSISECTSSP